MLFGSSTPNIYGEPYARGHRACATRRVEDERRKARSGTSCPGRKHPPEIAPSLGCRLLDILPVSGRSRPVQLKPAQASRAETFAESLSSSVLPTRDAAELGRSSL